MNVQSNAIPAILGALAVGIGAFLPAAEPKATILFVRSNTLIQSGDGWLFVAGAVGALLIAAQTGPHGTHLSWVIALLGIAAIIGAVLEGQITQIYHLDSLGDATGTPVPTSPGVGLWVIGAGGLLLAAGSRALRPTGTPAVTTPVASRREPGWHPDPAQPGILRWHDGQRWTGYHKPDDR